MKDCRTCLANLQESMRIPLLCMCSLFSRLLEESETEVMASHNVELYLNTPMPLCCAMKEHLSYYHVPGPKDNTCGAGDVGLQRPVQ